MKLNELNEIVNNSKPVSKIGKIIEIIGLTIIADGPVSSIGDLCHIVQDNSNDVIYCEVVGFRKDCILLMPLGSIEGLRAGAKASSSTHDRI